MTTTPTLDPRCDRCGDVMLTFFDNEPGPTCSQCLGAFAAHRGADSCNSDMPSDARDTCRGCPASREGCLARQLFARERKRRARKRRRREGGGPGTT